MNANTYSFLPIHIDAARNSTDDFNLFHDKNKWNLVDHNPFGGPIVLGFQLECLIEHQIRRFREQHGETAIMADNGLRFSNYQFTFANVVKPEEPISIDIKNSKYSSGENPTLSNRIALRNARGLVLTGYKKESRQPLFLSPSDCSELEDLRQVPDRSFLADGSFLKRKYMNTGNAKNFLSGSLVEQSDYFDELQDKVHFPEIFPAALISCALLEKALKEKHDFEKAPMVYTSHSITVDRKRLGELCSNDVLNILVRQPEIIPGDKALGKSGISQQVYQCFGFVQESPLYGARIAMTPLAEILKSATHRQASDNLRES